MRIGCRITAVACVLLYLLPDHGRASTAGDVAQDRNELRKIIAWHVSGTSGVRQPATPPDQVCGITELASYEIYRMDYEVASTLSNTEATTQIAALDRKVVAFLSGHGWSKLNMGSNGQGIPNLKRCYQKQGAIAQIYQTTGRCAMSSPCTAYDGFAVTFYLPGAKK